MNNINKSLRILIIAILFNIAFSTLAFAQTTYTRKISISEWIEEMEKCEKSEYWLENTEIYYAADKDSLYHWDQPRNKPTEKDSIKVKIITPFVVLRHCKLPDNNTCQIRNLAFQNNISFGECGGGGQVIFYNCTFSQGLEFLGSDLNQIEFLYCSILQRTAIIESQIGMLIYGNCSFFTDRKSVKSVYKIGYEVENKNYQYLFIIHQNEKKINTFYLSDCKILPTEVTPILDFSGGKYDVIGIGNTNFSNCIFSFSNCSIKENFTIRGCKFSMPLGLQSFNFPKDNTSFNWSQIDSIGLGCYSDFGKTPYTSKTDSLISDIDIYNELNSSYRKFYSMYRTQGDMESANACYNQMKDMETVKYRYLYQKNKNIQTWFNWRFNQFLKYFSEYGTNPVKSLIFSMWTILIFAAVYFFFYSDWDGINRTFMIKQHRKMMQYFRSEQKLEDFYIADYIDDLKSFDDYKKEIAESKAEIPVFIFLLGKPLYLLSIIRHKILSFIYRRTEILQGRWIDLKTTRKAFVGITVGVSILIYLIVLAFIRALNSTTLSINAFSTLGFGAIPVKGLSRYITIIEGFIGWFLLSIFSVSLISQMLQS